MRTFLLRKDGHNIGEGVLFANGQVCVSGYGDSTLVAHDDWNALLLHIPATQVAWHDGGPDPITHRDLTVVIGDRGFNVARDGSGWRYHEYHHGEITIELTFRDYEIARRYANTRIDVWAMTDYYRNPLAPVDDEVE